MNLLKWFKRPKYSQEIKIDFNQLPAKSRSNLGLTTITTHAQKLGYSIKKIDYKTGMIRYQKEYCMINFYTTTGTITTEIKHPKKGKTQLHRKGLNMDQLKAIFNDPRTHTGKGYYKKRN